MMWAAFDGRALLLLILLSALLVYLGSIRRHD